MVKRLVLHNREGSVLRVYPWRKPETLWAVFRKDTKRLEVMTSLNQLKKEKVPFEVLAQASGNQLLGGPLKVGKFGHLELIKTEEISPIVQSKPVQKSFKSRKIALFSTLIYLFIGFLLNRFMVSDEAPREVQEEEKREIVKIVRKKLVVPQSSTRQTMVLGQNSSQDKTNPKALSSKRRGAFLAALGQLKKGSQKGGLDLGAVKVTKGIGSGGHQGSGGVQTSLYGKGLVAAPLGAGGNIKGGGGYGTKGKGGGKAGFGSLSLVGTSGASLIPLGHESSVGGGLDRGLITEVVQRNVGQIRFCYEQGLQLNASLSGLVSIFWVIDASGRVKSAKVQRSSLKNKTVEDCMLRRLRTWKFPIPKNSQDVKISYPFRLRKEKIHSLKK